MMILYLVVKSSEQCANLTAPRVYRPYGHAEQVSETDAVRGVWRTGTFITALVREDSEHHTTK